MKVSYYQSATLIELKLLNNYQILHVKTSENNYIDDNLYPINFYLNLNECLFGYTSIYKIYNSQSSQTKLINLKTKLKEMEKLYNCISEHITLRENYLTSKKITKK